MPDRTHTQRSSPIDWDARCHLASSILSWRPANSLTGTLARKALEGYSIEQLMSFERGVREMPEDGAA